MASTRFSIKRVSYGRSRRWNDLADYRGALIASSRPFVVIPSAIAEISMVVYLLVVGVKTPKAAARILAAA